MKASVKIANMNTAKDINKVKSILASVEGIIACQISKERKEVNIVYDNYFIELDNIIEAIEDYGYTVI